MQYACGGLLHVIRSGNGWKFWLNKNKMKLISSSFYTKTPPKPIIPRSPPVSEMKSPIPKTSLFLLVLVMILSISSSQIQCDDDLIDQICKKTPFYDLCLSSLKSSPSSSTMDIKGLATTMANIVLSNATDTLNFIQSQLKQASDPQMERALAYCAELYIPVVKYNIPQAMEALSKGQYGFAADGISDAAKEADACEKNFSGSLQSPITERNKLLHSLSDVAVGILKALLN